GLEGRRVLVVGASSGIGRALALSAAAAGARVALGARRLDLVEEAADEIRRAGGDARAWPCDVTSLDDCRALVEAAAQFMGGIDVVLYLSGSSSLLRVADASPAQWHDLLATNLVGAATVVAHALEHLRRAADPVVMVTTTTMGDHPWPWLTVYGATKAALAEMAKGLRHEEPGLRVLCVAVGPTVTAFADGWDPETAAAAFTAWAEGDMMHYGVLEATDMATAIIDAVNDTDGPDDILIAADLDA
ncbi:MAG TPA: SDR family NAD(P)-dependent oxidoreductase, partial [Acidimicrobiales bacterium]|nr:SDR family NAD(P)-dependent oxidoreductase [Acidimicrobiales bacterium]